MESRLLGRGVWLLCHPGGWPAAARATPWLPGLSRLRVSRCVEHALCRDARTRSGPRAPRPYPFFFATSSPHAVRWAPACPQKCAGKGAETPDLALSLSLSPVLEGIKSIRLARLLSWPRDSSGAPHPRGGARARINTHVIRPPHRSSTGSWGCTPPRVALFNTSFCPLGLALLALPPLRVPAWLA